MKKFIVSLFIITTITPAFAYYTTTSNGFKSNLRMNQPRTQIVGHTGRKTHYYRPPRYYYPPKTHQKRSLLRRISNYFEGVPTGFTPSVDPNLSQNLSPMMLPGLTPYGGIDSYYPTGSFGNNSFEQYSNGFFGGGWGHHNNNFTSGTGVTILD